jgi:hypothetical protein
MMIYLRFCSLWNFRLRKFGPKKLEDVNRHKIRHNLTIAVNVIKILGESQENQAKKLMFNFCKVHVKNLTCVVFTQKVKKTFGQISYIQKRLRDKLAT